jgi:hypothetical protein
VLPRCVLVERSTEYRDLLARHGTREQARFFLKERGLAIEEVEDRHHAQQAHRTSVLAAVPPDWRTATVMRDELDRFLFEPDDVVIVLGQDGLVANAAKYLTGQPVVGLNPDPERNAGVLVAHPPRAAADLLRDLHRGRASVRARTMAEARLDDGQRLLALNEVFFGHASHQSARYVLGAGGREERQSSSGVIVATGTGATGWAASIHLERHSALALPAPGDRRLAFFVREAWPGPATGTTLTEGVVEPPAELAIRNELSDSAVVFGDGIETDRLTVDWAQRVTVGVAPDALRLVV